MAVTTGAVPRNNEGEMKIFALVLLLVGALALAAAQGRPDVPFQVLERGQNSGEKTQNLKVIRTQKAFEEYLKDRGETGIPKGLKDVDWTKEQVVVVYGGEQPTGGFGVEVKRILSSDVQRLNLEAILIRPRPNTIVTQAFTTPYIIVKMPRQVAAIRLKFVLE